MRSSSSGSLQNTAVIPYNNSVVAETDIAKNGEEIAGGNCGAYTYTSRRVVPRPNYLDDLRRTRRDNFVLLIFEVIFGFKDSSCGAQQFYGVNPAIPVFGREISNGFPLNAVVGGKDVMAVTAPNTGQAAYSGTYKGKQPYLVVANVYSDKLKSGAVQEYHDPNLCHIP
jgi:glutamate-1-semialdehyde 2,1-aminomutase